MPRTSIHALFLIVLATGIPGCLLFARSGSSKVRPPTQFVEGYDGNWKIIEVRPGLDQTALWQTTVDAIAIKFDMESLDPSSGYLRTGWKTGYGVNAQDASAESYRVRVIGKFEPGFQRLRLKAEAEWQSMHGFDKRLTEEIYSELQGRIGRVVR